jgi:ribonuclease HII
MSLVIGCDESGTGAWAGPFYIGAVVCDVVSFNREIGRYLKDSKALSDVARRKLAPRIREHAIAHTSMEVGVPEIARGPRKAWRQGILLAVDALWFQLSKMGVSLNDRERATMILDGPVDTPLMQALKRLHPSPRFEIDADAKYPAVMAAAILAKTARNDAMLQLDGLYPEFDWKQNSGYGTAKHLAACREYGVTPHHRLITRLKGLKAYQRRDWFASGTAEAVSAPVQDAREGVAPVPGAGRTNEAPGGM